MARWIICQTKEAKRSKIAGTAGEIVGNFVRIYYVHNVLAQGFEVVGGGGYLYKWVAHCGLHTDYPDSGFMVVLLSLLKSSVRIEFQMTPRPLPCDTFYISNFHSPSYNLAQ